jgi:uncharacterized membrane protein
VLYRIILLLHILASIVGFGGLVAGAMFNARAFASPAGQSRTILMANQAMSKTTHNGLYAVVLLGIVLIALSDNAFGYGDPWVSAGFVIWFTMIGLSHGLVRPAMAGLVQRTEAVAAAAEGPGLPPLSSDAQAEGLARRLAVGEGAIQLLLVAALVVMIWKPGL